MLRDGRGPGRRTGTSSEGRGERGDSPQPGKRTLTEQLGSEVRRSPPLFDGDSQWETIEELETQLGDGEAVDPGVAAHVSRTTGQDVSGARVHRGPVAAAMAAKRSATAFAVGKHIVMGAGAPAPGTPAGDALLAHELAHTAQQGGAAADPAERKKPIGEEDQAAERDAGLARLGNFAGAIGDVMRTGLQLQRCAEVKPAKVTELRGKEAEAKLAELGGRLATDPDYSGGRKAIAGSRPIPTTAAAARRSPARTSSTSYSRRRRQPPRLASISGPTTAPRATARSRFRRSAVPIRSRRRRRDRAACSSTPTTSARQRCR